MTTPTYLIYFFRNYVEKIKRQLSKLGATTDLTSVPASFADLAAVKTYLDTLIPEVEGRLDALEAKVDEVIQKLQEVDGDKH